MAIIFRLGDFSDSLEEINFYFVETVGKVGSYENWD